MVKSTSHDDGQRSEETVSGGCSSFSVQRVNMNNALSTKWSLALVMVTIIAGLLSMPSCSGGGGGGGNNYSNSSGGGGGGGGSEPPASDTVVLTATALTPTRIGLSWTAPSGLGSTAHTYVYSSVYRDGTEIASYYMYSYTDTNLQPDTNHCYYVIVASEYCGLWSCYDSGEWTSNTACTTTRHDLFIQSTFPESNASNVPVNAAISATYYSDIDSQVIKSSSIIISGPSGTVSGATAVNGSIISFTPSNDLFYNTTYAATVVSNKKDGGGNIQTYNYSWTFTTGVTPDSIPPSIPAGITATPVSTSQIDLLWNKATDNAGVAGYKIFRDGQYVKSAPYTEVAASDTGLNEVTQYCYSMSAYDWAGNESPQSSPVCVKTLPFQVVSTNPSNGAESIPVNAIIVATFNAEVDPLSVTYSSFIMSGPSGAITGSLAVNGSHVSFTPSGYLNYKTIYTVTITAAVRDTAGYSLSHDYTWTFISGLTPDSVPPSIPTGLTALAAEDRVNLSWDASTDNALVSGYYIYRDGKLFTTVTNTTSASDPIILLNMQYCYSVSAFDVADNVSQKSEPICVTTSNLAPGRVAAWGDNHYGQIGNVYTHDTSLPNLVSNLANITNLSAGLFHSLALKSDGTVWAWGENNDGQLGDGTFESKTEPTQVKNSFSFIEISAATAHSLALKSDGTVWAWGLNTVGQLGDGTYVTRAAPVQVLNLTNITTMSAGWAHSLVLKSDGTVWAWGQNYQGQLGDGTYIIRNAPVQVLNLTNVSAISAGGGHSLALKPDGTVWAWGSNDSGQLGDGTLIGETTAIQVPNLTNVSAISAGSYHSLALKSDGTVWAWGANNYGQLGDGAIINRTIPVQVSGLSDVVAISGGRFHSLALKSDGTVWAWGQNYEGQLGDGTGINSYTPVQTYKLNGISVIDAGGHHSIALK